MSSGLIVERPKRRYFIYVAVFSVFALVVSQYFSEVTSDEEVKSETSTENMRIADTDTLIPIPERMTAAVINASSEDGSESLADEPDFQINSEIWRWIQSLKQSETVEDLLILSLLPGLMVPEQDNEALLLLAYSKDPNNNLLGLRIMEYCYQHQHSSLCALPIVDNLLRNNSDDGVTVVSIAAFLVENGDPERALDLLFKAGNLSHRDRLQMRVVALADRSFQKHGFTRSHTTLFELEGIADGAFPDLRRVHQVCSDQTRWNDENWQQACASYFDNLSKNSNNLVEGGIAIYSYIQFSGMSKQQADATLKLREEKLLEANLLLSQAYRDLEAQAGASEFLIDDETWQIYLDEYESKGDVIARNNLIRSILRNFNIEGR